MTFIISAELSSPRDCSTCLCPFLPSWQQFSVAGVRSPGTHSPAAFLSAARLLIASLPAALALQWTLTSLVLSFHNPVCLKHLLRSRMKTLVNSPTPEEHYSCLHWSSSVQLHPSWLWDRKINPWTCQKVGRKYFLMWTASSVYIYMKTLPQVDFTLYRQLCSCGKREWISCKRQTRPNT